MTFGEYLSINARKGCHTERSRSIWAGLYARPSTTLRMTTTAQR